MSLLNISNFSKCLFRQLNVVKICQESKHKLLTKFSYKAVSIHVKRINELNNKNKWVQKRYNERDYKTENRPVIPFGFCGSLALMFTFFSRNEEEEDSTPEGKLIKIIKRSLICIQKEQYDKAEQMLHLALRMAQDIHSIDGITYIFDVMANLAMEREQYKKADKLFTEVMKRLFAKGYDEDSPQILHISSKLAHMSHLQGDLDKSFIGFIWTLKKIEEYIRKEPDDKDVQELHGLTKNWFGQLQIKLGKYADAKKNFMEAYSCLVEIYGTINEEAITILNNLSVACVNLDDFEDAKRYLIEAINLTQELNDATQEGILQANLGLIFLREGLISQAKETCGLAWRMGKNSKNAEAVEQAEYCLNEIKSFEQE